MSNNIEHHIEVRSDAGTRLMLARKSPCNDFPWIHQYFWQVCEFYLLIHRMYQLFNSSSKIVVKIGGDKWNSIKTEVN